MSDSHASGGSVPPDRIVVSGPTRSPWLRILARCLAVAVGAIAVVCVVAALVAGVAAVLSVLYGSAIVVTFFAISLLVGHYGGRNSPSGAIGLFMLTYLVKVVGFAAVLFFLGAPGWLDAMWSVISAVVVVVVWQGTEVFAFSRTRHLLYGDPQEHAAAKPAPGHPDALEGTEDA
ncbi:hypothetical protein [Arthrobacter terrae]|uniref:hypothetical protein n=1 Tax=Arthrobacter terrae TaxID=2935737 RepID=UPI001E4763D7|nr:hypothetical protein [Arthrobacter terrae]